MRNWSGPPEFPLPPGSTVCQRMEPLVNGERILVTLAQTPWGLAEVERFYRRGHALQGWQEAGIPKISGSGRRVPLVFHRKGWEGTVFSSHDSARGATTLLVRVRPVGTVARRPQSYLCGLPGRLDGFPVFPGIKGALLVESGAPHYRAALLFETEATLEQVVQFYRQRLGPGIRPFPDDTTVCRCVSGLFPVRRRNALLNLCRRPGGGTSVLVALERPAAADAALGEEVRVCSGGGT